jgi:hypothetical protein
MQEYGSSKGYYYFELTTGKRKEGNSQASLGRTRNPGESLLKHEK